jgi:hypothetical protein
LITLCGNPSKTLEKNLINTLIEKSRKKREEKKKREKT